MVAVDGSHGDIFQGSGLLGSMRRQVLETPQVMRRDAGDCPRTATSHTVECPEL
ncbi:uncharacterized protein B0I36DRAFT_311783 [Microdochium trichocladiopsis]|uniref:Uncharacterized protein n=1 Tax=Microdochium trichocladiopsis TaxID=1682393 RepID=A0A9P8YFS5_9PEZI|nr:uncharacterized protein B0I36DRAFT_311783 [Microdochium trichocladiopsis]KAH7040937.1 hypothetical protein B0I36DRAFT_311783 [Microdochium trichocladiopsis]